MITANISETITDELMQRLYAPDMIVADVQSGDKTAIEMKISDVQGAEKLEKFVEDVKWVDSYHLFIDAKVMIVFFFAVFAGTESTH